eukprot:g7832.t1
MHCPGEVPCGGLLPPPGKAHPILDPFDREGSQVLLTVIPFILGFLLPIFLTCCVSIRVIGCPACCRCCFPPDDDLHALVVTVQPGDDDAELHSVDADDADFVEPLLESEFGRDSGKNCSTSSLRKPLVVTGEKRQMEALGSLLQRSEGPAVVGTPFKIETCPEENDMHLPAAEPPAGELPRQDFGIDLLQATGLPAIIQALVGGADPHDEDATPMGKIDGDGEDPPSSKRRDETPFAMDFGVAGHAAPAQTGPRWMSQALEQGRSRIRKRAGCECCLMNCGVFFVLVVFLLSVELLYYTQKVYDPHWTFDDEIKVVIIASAGGGGHIAAAEKLYEDLKSDVGWAPWGRTTQKGVAIDDKNVATEIKNLQDAEIEIIYTIPPRCEIDENYSCDKASMLSSGGLYLRRGRVCHGGTCCTQS